MLAGAGEPLQSARAALEAIVPVELHDISTNDAWGRDHGPVFLQSERALPPALVDWGYNAWGQQVPALRSGQRRSRSRRRTYRPPLVSSPT